MLSIFIRNLNIQPTKDLKKKKEKKKKAATTPINNIFQAPFKREASTGFFVTLLSLT